MKRAVVASVLLLGGASRADSWWAPDKALHFSISAGLAISATAVSAAWLPAPRDRASRCAFALAATLALGIGKELADGLGLGSASFRDLTWNLAGAVVGAAAAWLFEALLVTPLTEALGFVG